MELDHALRTTGAVREFLPEPVDDEVVYRMLDAARFAPSGGNRQAWRVVVVRDRGLKATLRDLYLPGWYEYLAQSAAGLVPWAPITDADAETQALAGVDGVASEAAGRAGRVRRAPRPGSRPRAGPRRPAPAGHGGPRLRPLHARGWSVGLSLRVEHAAGGADEGLAGVMTTMVVRREPEVRAAFGVPDHMAVAALVALGRPVRQPTKLRRESVEEFATVDRLDGPALRGPG